MEHTFCAVCGVVFNPEIPFVELRTEGSKNFVGYVEISYVKCPVCKEEVVIKEEEFYNEYQG